MATCPQCGHVFVTMVYRRVDPPYNGRYVDGVWEERLECGHTWRREGTVYLSKRRRCDECLALQRAAAEVGWSGAGGGKGEPQRLRAHEQ